MYRYISYFLCYYITVHYRVSYINYLPRTSHTPLTKTLQKGKNRKITCRHWKIQDFLDEFRVGNISHGSHQSDFLFVQIGFPKQLHHGVQRASIAMFKDGAIHRWPQVCCDRRLALTVCIKSLIRFSYNVCFAIFSQARYYKSSKKSVKMTLENGTEINIAQWFRASASNAFLTDLQRRLHALQAY